MGHVCHVGILITAFVIIVTVREAHSKIKKVEFIVDSATNRRVGYVVTRVHAIDRKDDFNETSSATKGNSTKIDNRNSLGEEEHEHEGEMVLVEQIPDTQAMETSYVPDAQAVETSYPGEFGSPSFDKEEVQYHHSHHEVGGEKVITIVKTVPEIVPVEKTVHVPVIKKVPYVVEVPDPEPYPIEKQKFYPVRVIVKVPVKIPKPYAVFKESFYPVHVPVERKVPHRVYEPLPIPVERKVYYEVKVPVPEPFPVDRNIPIPIRIPIYVPQPLPIERPVPFPVKIEEERPVPVPYDEPFPVEITKPVSYADDKAEVEDAELPYAEKKESTYEKKETNGVAQPKRENTTAKSPEPPKVHEGKTE